MRTAGLRRLQRQRDAGQRAAGAAGAGEGVDLAAGLLPDLRRRWWRGGPRGWRDCRTGWPRSRLAGCRHLLGQPARHMHVVAGIAIRLGRHQPQIGADHAQEILLLLALRLRHHDDAAIAAGIADQRQADAGIAGRALDDRAARLQRAALLRILDDRQRRAVLDRAAGIHELGLAQDLAAGRLRGAAQPDQRRIADRASARSAARRGQGQLWVALIS